MKIGIITVFYTENTGSILQAISLKNFLEDNGHDVYFINTRNRLSAHSLKKLIKDCIKNPFHSVSIIKKYFYYDKLIKSNFKIIDNYNNLDYILIGSDTVWDVDSSYFLESLNLFWFNSKNNIKTITYAASIANSDYKKLNSLNYVKECINNLNFISVRDSYTLEYINKNYEKKAKLVCDPTMLYEMDFYKRKYKTNIKKDKYLLLYLFNEPNDKVTESIKKFCNTNNLKIVCISNVGKDISFADYYIFPTIENFMNYYDNAEYVVTNTFHGTIFSIIFNKNFAVIDNNKKKVFHLLKQYNLSNRLFKENVESVLHSEIDYYIVNELIKKIRKDSIKYLEDCLK